MKGPFICNRVKFKMHSSPLPSVLSAIFPLSAPLLVSFPPFSSASLPCLLSCWQPQDWITENTTPAIQCVRSWVLDALLLRWTLPYSLLCFRRYVDPPPFMLAWSSSAQQIRAIEPKAQQCGRKEGRREGGGWLTLIIFFVPPIGLFAGLFLRSTLAGYVCFGLWGPSTMFSCLMCLGMFAISFIHFQHCPPGFLCVCLVVFVSWSGKDDLISRVSNEIQLDNTHLVGHFFTTNSEFSRSSFFRYSTRTHSLFSQSQTQVHQRSRPTWTSPWLLRSITSSFVYPEQIVSCPNIPIHSPRLYSHYTIKFLDVKPSQSHALGRLSSVLRPLIMQVPDHANKQKVLAVLSSAAYKNKCLFLFFFRSVVHISFRIKWRTTQKNTLFCTLCNPTEHRCRLLIGYNPVSLGQ